MRDKNEIVKCSGHEKALILLFNSEHLKQAKHGMKTGRMQLSIYSPHRRVCVASFHNGGKLGDTFAIGCSSFSTADKMVSCRWFDSGTYGGGGMGWMMRRMNKEAYVPAHDLTAVTPY